MGKTEYSELEVTQQVVGKTEYGELEEKVKRLEESIKKLAAAGKAETDKLEKKIKQIEENTKKLNNQTANIVMLTAKNVQAIIDMTNQMFR